MSSSASTIIVGLAKMSSHLGLTSKSLGVNSSYRRTIWPNAKFSNNHFSHFVEKLFLQFLNATLMRNVDERNKKFTCGANAAQ